MTSHVTMISPAGYHKGAGHRPTIAPLVPRTSPWYLTPHSPPPPPRTPPPFLWHEAIRQGLAANTSISEPTDDIEALKRGWALLWALGQCAGGQTAPGGVLEAPTIRRVGRCGPCSRVLTRGTGDRQWECLRRAGAPGAEHTPTEGGGQDPRSPRSPSDPAFLMESAMDSTF